MSSCAPRLMIKLQSPTYTLVQCHKEQTSVQSRRGMCLWLLRSVHWQHNCTRTFRNASTQLILRMVACCYDFVKSTDWSIVRFLFHNPIPKSSHFSLNA